MFQERRTPERVSQQGNFVGRGLSFPVRIGPTGGLSLSGGPQEIENSIRFILETAPGERLMRPDFGCSMWDQVFEVPDAGTLGIIETAVREALGRWEPRIELVEVQTEVLQSGGDQAIEIQLSYRIKATNDRRNLVHPFYMIPAEATRSPAATPGSPDDDVATIATSQPNPPRRRSEI